MPAPKRNPFIRTKPSDVPTPLFYRDRFYVASDLKKNLSCLDPKDGKGPRIEIRKRRAISILRRQPDGTWKTARGM